MLLLNIILAKLPLKWSSRDLGLKYTNPESKINQQLDCGKCQQLDLSRHCLHRK